MNAKAEDGDTPLMKAIKMRVETIVQLLIANGKVDPNVSNMDGDTPLMMAMRLRYSTIV